MSLSIILVATTHYSQVSASKCLSSRLTSPSLRIFHECTVHRINVRGFFPIALQVSLANGGSLMFGTFSIRSASENWKMISRNPMIQVITSWEDTSGHQILANLYTVDILWRYLDLHYGEVPLVLWSKYVVFLRNAAKRARWLSTLWPSYFEESVERNKRDPLGRDRGRIFSYHSRLTYLSGLVFLLGSLPSDHS